MIRSFSHAGLEEVFLQGYSAKFPSGLAAACRQRLFILHGATCNADIQMKCMTVQASARGKGIQEIPFMNRRIMFQWNGMDAVHVDFA